MSRRKARPVAYVSHLAPWQIEQAKRCPCRGSDDMCECQNVIWADRDAERAEQAALKVSIIAQAHAAIATGGREQVNPADVLAYFEGGGG